VANTKQIAKLLCAPAGIDSDTTPYLFKENFLNLINGKVASTDTGNTGAVQYILSNAPVTTVQAILSSFTGVFTCIGAVEDVNRSHIYLFEYNSEGNHLVIDVDTTTAPWSATVLLNNAWFTQGGLNKGLNFALQNLITGFALIGTTLFWTDNLNDPRRYDTVTLVSGTAFLDSYITIIRRPPGYPPSFSKTTVGGIYNNLIAANNFQFCFGYISALNEITVNGPYSTIANYNLATDLYNAIVVVMPLAEQIPLDVSQVVLFVRSKLGDNAPGPFYQIRVWNKAIVADATAIAQHNGGVQALTYLFSNNQVGAAQDVTFTAKPFDNVPNICKALEASNNRPFLANYTEGYNTPPSTSLAVSLVADPGTAITGSWHIFIFKSSCNGYNPETHVLIEIENVISPGYYYNPGETYPPYPVTEAFASLVFVGADESLLANFFRPGCTNEIVSLTQPVPPENQTATITGVSPASVDGRLEFKTNGSYQVGIVFYDTPLRNAGVMTSPPLQITIPPSAWGFSAYIQYIAWVLSNTNALAEIPVWAVYYSIVRTANLNYNSFAQGIAASVRYVSQQPDGTYIFLQGPYLVNTSYSLYIVQVSAIVVPPAVGDEYTLNTSTFQIKGMSLLQANLTSGTYAGQLYLYLAIGNIALPVGAGALTRSSGSGDATIHYSSSVGPTTITGVAVDISVLASFGLGYVYQPGDILTLFRSDGQDFTMSVKGQQGSFVLLSLLNVGDLTVGNVLNYDFEIATPKLSLLTNSFWEVGNMYPVTNAGTASRTYSILNGILRGDIYLRNRTSTLLSNLFIYVTENMSPNDLLWQYWNTDIGRFEAVVTQPGQVIDPVGVRFGNQLIQGTFINGTCSFDVLNQQDLPVECGDIQKLQLSSQVQEEGTVMLAIGLRNTVSLYISQLMIYQATGQAQQSSTDAVIGQMNVLLGGWGTAHPESVIEERGRIYWYSIYKGVVVRYSDDGIVEISHRGMKTFFAQRSRMLLALMAQGKVVQVPAYYDRYNEEYGLFLPAVSVVPNQILADVIPNTYQFNF